MTPANIRCLVRIRPFSNDEVRKQLSNNEILSFDQEGRLSISSSEASHSNHRHPISSDKRSFQFDSVLGPASSQSHVFEKVKEIVDGVARGYNGTIVAYGQTGSGKTHTVFGSGGVQGEGLVQRSLNEIFQNMTLSKMESIQSPPFQNNASKAESSAEFSTRASFVEIFNERVYDLLSTDPSLLEVPLSVREDSKNGVYVEGLSEIDVKNTAEAEAILRRGIKNRHVASTAMNRTSSRSHAIFFLNVKSVFTGGNGVSRIRQSKFSLVDLAGSERQCSTGASGARLKEASMINKSLHCLGQVINALADREIGKERIHIPFRDSKLTFLLRDSWGGNSKTCLVATVSPSILSFSETLSTLNFAQRAKLIRNTVMLNEDTNSENIVALQEEVSKLREQLRVSKANEKNASRARNLDENRLVLKERNLNSILSPCNKSLSKKFDNGKGNKIAPKLQPTETCNEGGEYFAQLYNDEKKVTRSLKRKLVEEKAVRRLKQCRIDYLTKRRIGFVDGEDELISFENELESLQRQLDAPSAEALKWKFAYEKLKYDLLICSEESSDERLNMMYKAEILELKTKIEELKKEKKSLQNLFVSEKAEKTEFFRLKESENLLKKQILEKEKVIDNFAKEKNALISERNEAQEEINVLLEEIDRLANEQNKEIDASKLKQNTFAISESDIDLIKVEEEKDEDFIMQEVFSKLDQILQDEEINDSQQMESEIELGHGNDLRNQNDQIISVCSSMDGSLLIDESNLDVEIEKTEENDTSRKKKEESITEEAEGDVKQHNFTLPIKIVSEKNPEGLDNEIGSMCAVNLDVITEKKSNLSQDEDVEKNIVTEEETHSVHCIKNELIDISCSTVDGMLTIDSNLQNEEKENDVISVQQMEEVGKHHGVEVKYEQADDIIPKKEVMREAQNPQIEVTPESISSNTASSSNKQLTVQINGNILHLTPQKYEDANDQSFTTDFASRKEGFEVKQVLSNAEEIDENVIRGSVVCKNMLNAEEEKCNPVTFEGTGVEQKCTQRIFSPNLTKKDVIDEAVSASEGIRNNVIKEKSSYSEDNVVIALRCKVAYLETENRTLEEQLSLKQDLEDKMKFYEQERIALLQKIDMLNHNIEEQNDHIEKIQNFILSSSNQSL